jgi:hypothetical protein
MHRRTKKISENTTLTLIHSYKSKFRKSNPKNEFKNNKNSPFGIPIPKRVLGAIKTTFWNSNSIKDSKNSSNPKNNFKKYKLTFRNSNP